MAEVNQAKAKIDVVKFNGMNKFGL